ncbi:MAG: transporter substrate-binding domain-containing protein [bacterium]
MKKFLRVILSGILVISLVGCGSSSDQEGQEASILEQIKEKGSITMATSPDYPPYEFKIMEDGKETVVGFDIEIAKEIASDLGVELLIEELDFNALLVALNTNKADMVLAGMSPSEERIKEVDFSEVYYEGAQGILINASDANDLTSLDSFQDKSVAVQKGSIQEAIAEEQLVGAKLVSLGKVPNMVMELTTGKVSGIVMEMPVAEGYLKQFPELAIANIEVPYEVDGCAVAIKKGNEDLVEAVNQTLSRLESEGKIVQFVEEANEIVATLNE